jgi:hypothetical protein
MANLGERAWKIALIVCLMTAAALPATAQVINTAASPITLNAVLSETITLTLSANAVNFNLAQGSANNPGSIAITATTSWAMARRRTLRVYAYFASAASALTDGTGDNIPSSAFEISDSGGAFNALVNTVPFGGANAGLQLARVRIRRRNRVGTRNDVMNFNINLSTLPNLPAGSYTGTLNIRVQAI